jgi:hypothetical protein
MAPATFSARSCGDSGTRYPLGGDERRAIRTGAVEAEVSDLTGPENRFERPKKKLLEVYLPIRTAGGRGRAARRARAARRRARRPADAGRARPARLTPG